MNVPRCKTHRSSNGTGAVAGCDQCEAEQRALLAIAATPLCGPVCRCGAPISDVRKHKAWHEGAR